MRGPPQRAKVKNFGSGLFGWDDFVVSTNSEDAGDNRTGKAAKQAMFRSAFLVPRRERNKEGPVEQHDIPAEREPSELTVRRLWVQDLNRYCQEFVGTFIPDSPRVEIGCIDAFVAGLPAPRGPVEELIVKAVLLDLMLRIAGTGNGRPGEKQVGIREPRSVQRLRIQPGWGPECALNWTLALHEAVGAALARSAALRAACIMRGRFAEHWPLGRLAREAGTTPEDLKPSFHGVFGIRPREYLQRVRVKEAVKCLQRGDKVEFIPADVGYRSRKNMNAAFRRVVGLAPSSARAMQEEDVAALVKERIDAWLMPLAARGAGRSI